MAAEIGCSQAGQRFFFRQFGGRWNSLDVYKRQAMGEEVWEAVDELIKNRESTIDLILVVTSGRVNA